ncbi:hypothetical protein [Methylococcus geothermalis]|uniref:Uncharacterized protein n=1 Tax=Methylococcus geothermalis TaxID=2681310 RepID=A0A858Q9R1_9GAMM|nr:hypothetical protein [Methylococcus geothermalis]QJD30495.1 hypothetical protein GNH96_11260 [Methylococcus geothermalis]
MLKTIDILLGITVVMLIASMAVTVLTQLITDLANTRGKHLARGLGDLLRQIDPSLSSEMAEQVSRAVLTHPMISDVGQRLGATIHREEFTKLLLDIASGQTPRNDKNRLSDPAKQILAKLIENNGIRDPAATLENVRAYALQLEMSRPELATNVRHNMALLQEANSRLVAKINAWFDQTIDRVSERFTASTRMITVACSVAVVAAVQLDTIDIINRLSIDEGLRNALVEKAFALDERPRDPGRPERSGDTSKPRVSAGSSGNASPVPSPYAKGSNGTPASPGRTDEAKGKPPVVSTAPASASMPQPAVSAPDPTGKPAPASVRTDLEYLQDLGLINVLGSSKSWYGRWREVNPIGMILSVFLLSLGAPFWYAVLQNLLKLRGILAVKDDEQRRERQNPQPPADLTAGGTQAAPPLVGERGVLG